jgi:hypothetical protein
METAKRYTSVQLWAFVALTAVLAAIGTRLILNLLTATTSGNSPVKVRGGAMTFRTESGGQFQQVGTSNSYCIVLSTTSTNLTLDLFQPGNHQKTPNKSIALANQTQIDFFGRNEKGKIKKNGNEIRVLISSSCNGTQGISATLTPIADSAFYLNQKDGASQDGDDDPNAPDTSHSVRFQDLDCATNFLPIPPSPGAMPQNPNGDEDFCENLGLIYVSSAPTTTPTSVDPWARCHNGDCSLEINVH